VTDVTHIMYSANAGQVRQLALDIMMQIDHSRFDVITTVGPALNQYTIAITRILRLPVLTFVVDDKVWLVTQA
jgi:hypothetical protein